MRNSGETKALEDEDDEEPRTARSHSGHERTDADSRDASAASRPYPIWLKVEPSKRCVAPVPAGVSRATWTRLSRQIAAYLRSRLNNNVTLRLVVRRAAAEMLLAGRSQDDVAAALRSAVVEHPELATLDRTNVVTRRRASAELLDRMLKWSQEIGSRDRGTPGSPDSAF